MGKTCEDAYPYVPRTVRGKNRLRSQEFYVMRECIEERFNYVRLGQVS